MDYLPLTRSEPFAEFPVTAGMDPLFDELAPLAGRPIEVTATVAAGDSRRTVMHLLVAEGDAPRAAALAVSACRGIGDFEVTVGRFAGE